MRCRWSSRALCSYSTRRCRRRRPGRWSSSGAARWLKSKLGRVKGLGDAPGASLGEVEADAGGVSFEVGGMEAARWPVGSGS